MDGDHGDVEKTLDAHWERGREEAVFETERAHSGRMAASGW